MWDDSGDCEHKWGNENTKNLTEQTAYVTGRAGGNARALGNKLAIGNKIASQGQFCQKCNAWRGSLGLEPTPELYIQHIVQVFREVRRVLRKDGTVFLNIGDSYVGGGTHSGHKNPGLNKSLEGRGGFANQHIIKVKNLKPKDLCMTPARVALALQADGWWLRSMMPWVKRSAMPESCDDRPASALDYVFLLSKSKDYYFDMEAVRVAHQDKNHPIVNGKFINPKAAGGVNDPQWKAEKKNGIARQAFAMKNREYNPAGRNFRNTDLFFESIKPPHGMIFADEEPVGLDVNPQSFKGDHFATFAEALVMPLIKAGTSEKGCCPECGGPWVRIIEKMDPEKRSVKSEYPGKQTLATLKYKHDSPGPVPKTIGWEPSCDCAGVRRRKGDDRNLNDQSHNLVPCTVLDPFSGSGRVLIVAKKLGRKAIGIDLKAEYLEMPLKKLAQERLI